MIRDAFWSHDYITGVDALLNALKATVGENRQFVMMVEERARIEHSRAAALAQIAQTPAFSVPFGTNSTVETSVSRAVGVLASETVNEAVLHTRIGADLEKQVHAPLKTWCAMYRKSVETCGSELQALVSQYIRLQQSTAKKRAVYYEHCRQFEDASNGGSPSDALIKITRLLRDKLGPEPLPTAQPVQYRVAGLNYTRKELSALFTALLDSVSLSEYKVPFLGSYHNVCSGSMLATAARKHLQNDSFAYADKFGQSLVDLGFLKPVGQISNRYQSTHDSHYQWQSIAFDLVQGKSEESEESEESDEDQTPATPQASSPAPSDALRLVAGATDSTEEDYLHAVLELEGFRCTMEQDIDRIYTFLDKLERDRIDALKKALRDYIRCCYRLEDNHILSRRILEAQSRIDPERDLQTLVKTHQTGPYVPTVTIFEGYFSTSVVQTFGVDLARSEFFIDDVLEWFKTRPKSEINLSLWTNREPVSEINKLRNQINTGKQFNPEITFRFFSVGVVVATFCQFLLELPESLVSFLVYERIKEIYAGSADPNAEVLASVLVQVPYRSCAELEKVIEYLRNTFPETEDQDKLAAALSLVLVRPRAPSALNMNDTHPQKFLVDLLAKGPEVFQKLHEKRVEMDSQRSVVSRNITPMRNLVPESSPVRGQINAAPRPLSLTMRKPDPKHRGLGIPSMLPINLHRQEPGSEHGHD